MSEVRIARHELSRQRWPREYHACLQRHGVKIAAFENMGHSQPLYDWLEHDLRRLLLEPWKLWNDPATDELVIDQ